jgi:hypothetical protein
MEQYNITPAIISDHLSSLYFSPDKPNPLAEVPSAVKGKLTRLFNKRHEDSKLKQATKSKGNVLNIKFNPLMEEMEE